MDKVDQQLANHEIRIRELEQSASNTSIAIEKDMEFLLAEIAHMSKNQDEMAKFNKERWDKLDSTVRWAIGVVFVILTGLVIKWVAQGGLTIAT